jgi:hypothetical protein
MTTQRRDTLTAEVSSPRRHSNPQTTTTLHAVVLHKDHLTVRGERTPRAVQRDRRNYGGMGAGDYR